GLTTSVRSPVGRTKGGIMGQTRSRGGQDSLPRGRGRPNLRASPVPPCMNPSPVALISSYRRPTHPMAPSPATIERFLAHCHRRPPRRRAPAPRPPARSLAHCHRRPSPPRTEGFRPGDPAGRLYYVISGSVSMSTEEADGRELVLGYFGNGGFVGEMGLFIES